MALNYVQVGRRVEEIRKRRGITQIALAEMVSKSATYISYVEGGIRCMSMATFVAIANALQVSADELLIDSIENTVKVSNHEFADLLSDCSEYEKRVLFEIAKATKNALRESRHLLFRGRR